MLGGRGSGKTHSCTRYVIDHVHGPPCLTGSAPHWIGIIAPTLGDAVTSCVKGPSGLESLDPSARMVTTPGGTVVRWPNGSEAKLFGAENERDVDRLRSGGNRCIFWVEEVAALRHLDAAFNHMRFGLRVGPHPHWIGSTTPRPRKLIVRLNNGEIPNVVITRATMWDNPHLSADVREALESEYAGKMIGRQELFGEIIEEAEGALWQRVLIDATRVTKTRVPSLERITVGVDPSGGAGEQGIVVAGRSGRMPTPPLPADVLEAIGLEPDVILKRGPEARRQGFVLADKTVHKSPSGWAKAAVKAAVTYDADDIVVEVNYGGDMAIATIRTAADALGVPIPIRKVTATRGKKVRAEPVSALTAENRWHLVGTHPELESQMATWTDDLDWSPDRLDAMVWTAWHTKLATIAAVGRGGFAGSAMSTARVVGGR